MMITHMGSPRAYWETVNGSLVHIADIARDPSTRVRLLPSEERELKALERRIKVPLAQMMHLGETIGPGRTNSFLALLAARETLT
jgi:hypothetical protein